MSDIRLLSSRKFDQFALQTLFRRLKANLRITSNDLDGVLLPCLTTAVEDSETYIGTVIVPSTFTYRANVAASSSFLLDLPGNVTGFTATIAGKATEGVLQAGRKLFLAIPQGGELCVTWTAGMTDIPDNIAHAVILKAATLFDNPMDTVKERVTVADKLLNPFKRFER